jgi:hypothetical protein
MGGAAAQKNTASPYQQGSAQSMQPSSAMLNNESTGNGSSK